MMDELIINLLGICAILFCVFGIIALGSVVIAFFVEILVDIKDDIRRLKE
jgi:hypothetical protein